MQNFPKFSTARLVLSLPTISDLEGIIFHANSTSEIAENTITFPYPYEEKHAHFWLKMAEEGFAKKDANIFGEKTYARNIVKVVCCKNGMNLKMDVKDTGIINQKKISKKS